eukprot:TRINITY_DN34955_c0_g1_i1.p1 TRINITY_DN34955_c0_g1~~TRINITY_DN34955_c0_g1_i1.p1  ORF type:complete len:1084 (+),score=307.36 TRINITY_DN34955_c0_g1_i1:42-3254(+)
MAARLAAALGHHLPACSAGRLGVTTARAARCRRRPYAVATHADAVEEGLRSGSPDAGLLLGRSAPASSSSVVQQSNAVFARVRVGASARQLVDALQQLAAIGRDASVADVDALTGRPQSQQLLRDLAARLPRDAAEHIEWEAAWTSQVVAAMRELRMREVDSQLGVRLSHALLKSSGDMELEELLRAVCDLSTAFGATNRLPDTYALWLLGERLKGLCESRVPGDLPLSRLVALLHQFAHPAIRGRVAACSSEVVLRHVRQGIPKASVGELASLLQAYSDDSAVADVLLASIEALAGDGAAGLLAAASLEELTAIAVVLPSLAGSDAGAAPAIVVAERVLNALQAVTRNAEVLENDGKMDLELLASCAAGAAEASSSTAAPSSLLAVLDRTGALVASACKANQAVSPTALCGLLCVSLGRTAELPQSAEWFGVLADVLSDRLAELPGSRLPPLAAALAVAGLPSGGTVVSMPAALPELFQRLQQVAVMRAPSMPSQEVSVLLHACGAAGILEEPLLQACDIEAAMAKGLPLSAVARLVWAAAVADANSEAEIDRVLWLLLTSHMDNVKAEWQKLLPDEKALLHEVLMALEQLHGLAPKPGSGVAELLAEDSGKAAWEERIKVLTRPSAHGDEVATLLKAMDINFQRDKQSQEGLYNMPFFLPEQNVVIDMMAVSGVHPASGRVRGDVALRHRMWAEQGRSILAIPDSTWAKRAASEKAAAEEAGKPSSEEATGSDLPKGASPKQSLRSWLQEKLDDLLRVNIIREADFPEDGLRRLAGLPLGKTGVNADGLRALKRLPDNAQVTAVKKFLTSTREKKDVTNPTAWFIGIVNNEFKKIEEEKAKPTSTSTSSARSARPEGGWSHESAKELNSVKVGEFVSGAVTNMLGRRTWVNAGLVKDVTFTAGSGVKLEVGTQLDRLRVVRVDEEKEQIEVKPTTQTYVALKKQGGAQATTTKKNTAKVKEAAGKASPQDKKPVAKAEKKEKERTALAWRPEAGWGHADGKPVSEFHVGQAVEGKVTNQYKRGVFVDIGAEKDASFQAEPNTHKVGDVLNLSVVALDLDQKRIEVEVK